MRARSRRAAGLRLTALALGCAVCGGACLRLCGGQGASGLWRQTGLLGLTFAVDAQAAGKTLQQWLSAAAPAAAVQPLPPTQPAAQPVQGSTQKETEPTGQAVLLPEAPPTAESIPADWLPVREVAYPDTGAGERYIPLAAGSIRNLTSYTAVQVRQTVAQGGLPFAVTPDSAEPQVLIVHTHATECYAEADGWVSPDNNGRTTDAAANMLAVGAELAAVLNAAGICTVQDTALHDHPSYNGSYGRSRAATEQWLAAYPSIKVVLDVHRDAIETNGMRIKPTAVINGQKAAQLMIISGADDGTMGMPAFWQNLRFAAALQAAVEESCDGLTRPVLFDYRNYNQQLTTGSLLIEVGGHANTLEEAQNSAQLIAQSLAHTFDNMQ